MTKIQKTTIFLLIAYIIWEVALRIWEVNTHTDSTIRIDLLFIYPVLLILIIISFFQYFKGKV